MSWPVSGATTKPCRGTSSRKPSTRRACSASRAGVVEMPRSLADGLGPDPGPGPQFAGHDQAADMGVAFSLSCGRAAGGLRLLMGCGLFLIIP